MAIVMEGRVWGPPYRWEAEGPAVVIDLGIFYIIIWKIKTRKGLNSLSLVIWGKVFPFPSREI